MDIIAWLVLGLIAGAIAKAVYPGHQGGGLLGTLILGVFPGFVLDFAGRSAKFLR